MTNRKLIVSPAEFEKEVTAAHRANVLRSALRKQQLRQSLEDNSEYQQRKRMTPSERGRDALERMARGIKAHNDAIAGNDTSFEQAMQRARKIANRYEHDKR